MTNRTQQSAKLPSGFVFDDNNYPAGTTIAATLYSSTVTYSQNQFVYSDANTLYRSLVDANTGNDLTSATHWQAVGGTSNGGGGTVSDDIVNDVWIYQTGTSVVANQINVNANNFFISSTNSEGNTVTGLDDIVQGDEILFNSNVYVVDNNVAIAGGRRITVVGVSINIAGLQLGDPNRFLARPIIVDLPDAPNPAVQTNYVLQVDADSNARWLPSTGTGLTVSGTQREGDVIVATSATEQEWRDAVDASRSIQAATIDRLILAGTTSSPTTESTELISLSMLSSYVTANIDLYINTGTTVSTQNSENVFNTNGVSGLQIGDRVAFEDGGEIYTITNAFGGADPILFIVDRNIGAVGSVDGFTVYRIDQGLPTFTVSITGDALATPIRITQAIVDLSLFTIPSTILNEIARLIILEDTNNVLSIANAARIDPDDTTRTEVVLLARSILGTTDFQFSAAAAAAMDARDTISGNVIGSTYTWGKGAEGSSVDVIGGDLDTVVMEVAASIRAGVPGVIVTTDLVENSITIEQFGTDTPITLVVNHNGGTGDITLDSTTRLASGGNISGFGAGLAVIDATFLTADVKRAGVLLTQGFLLREITSTAGTRTEYVDDDGRFGAAGVSYYYDDSDSTWYTAAMGGLAIVSFN